MDLFWIIIIYVFFGVLLYFVPLFLGKHRIRNFALRILSGRRWLLDITMPFWLTMCLSFLFNIFILKVQIPDVVIFLGIPINNGYWMLGVNMLFTIPTFFIGLALQRYFIQIIFSQHHISAMEQISNEPFILQAFVLELYQQFTDKPNFLKLIKDEETFDNIDSLIKDIKSSDGLKLSTYLYAILLRKSLSQTPSYLYSVWDTKIVNIDMEKHQEEYREYLNHLDSIYEKLTNKDKKIRIFVSDSPNFKEQFPSELKKQHKEWGFEKIYYCTSVFFSDIKTKMHVKAGYDDFILSEKWIIGKDRCEGRTRIDNNYGVIKDMKKIFTNHTNAYQQIDL